MNDSAATLRELLARNRETHPTYGGGLANHLSMELLSLAALGATSERLREFARDYSRHLDPLLADGPPIDATNWRASLGNRGAVSGFVRYFEGRIAEHGREAALRETLPELLPRAATQLYHGSIRTAFGVRFEDDLEVAHGLAYWASFAESLSLPPDGEGTEPDVLALLTRIRATKELAHAGIRGSSGTQRMRLAAELPRFAEVAGALAAREDTLEQLARASLSLFTITGNFSALHAVTATHALRVLLPYTDDRKRALRRHGLGIAAIYVASDTPELDPPQVDDVPTWEAIVARALPSNDDHDAKFVFACREEQSAYAGSPYRLAAARRVKLA